MNNESNEIRNFDERAKIALQSLAIEGVSIENPYLIIDNITNNERG